MSAIRRVSAIGRESDIDNELLVDRANWAVLRPRPEARNHGQQLWVDLNIALGHDISIVPRLRSTNGAHSSTMAYLATTKTTDIAISSSNWLTPTALTELAAAITAFGIRLWLIYAIETCDERYDTQLGLTANETTVDEFLAQRHTASIAHHDNGTSTFPEVLDVHFLGFLDIAEELNTPDEFDTIRAVFHRGRVEMHERLRSIEVATEQDLAHALNDITSHSCNLYEITTRVKGAQVGALLSGWHLRVDINSWLMRGISDSVTTRLTDHEWHIIDRLENPALAAIAGLCIAELSATEMLELTESNLASDLSSITINERTYPLPSSARALIESYWAHRQLAISDSDRFLINCVTGEELGPRVVATQTSQISAATGIALRLQRSETATTTNPGWNYRYGVSIERINT